MAGIVRKTWESLNSMTDNSPKLRELYANVEEMLETRDKIIRECLDKEKLEKARSRLALSKTLHSRLGENTPLDIDVIDKINTNLSIQLK